MTCSLGARPLNCEGAGTQTSAHEQKVHGGAVDRRGQQNAVRGPYPTIRSIMKQVFRRFRWIGLDLEIWRFLCRRQTYMFIPCCACARGNRDNALELT
jgi:hypothetical protein